MWLANVVNTIQLFNSLVMDGNVIEMYEQQNAIWLYLKITVSVTQVEREDLIICPPYRFNECIIIMNASYYNQKCMYV